MPNKKVVIIGAGPAGLFTAYELADKADVTIIDKGKTIEERCLERETKKEDNLHGVGGAGLFSDGKFIFSDVIGTYLPEVIGAEKTNELIEKVEKILENYGIIPNKRDIKKEKELIKKATESGIEYIIARQTHVGTENAPEIIKRFFQDLEKKVSVRCEEEAISINENKLITDNGEYEFDKLLIAVGRSGAEWLEKIVDELGIEYQFNPVDIGVRVEVPNWITKKICDVTWDFKARIITQTYKDMIRTFCVCPGGYVVKEDYETFSLVNGHTRKDKQSDNTNFAFLISYKLTEPIKSGNEWGRHLAEHVCFTGGNLPIVQRLGDLRRGRRSTEDRIKINYVKPTLKEATPADIGSSLGYRFTLDIIEGLEKLNYLVPGVNDDSTLLYCPEIKLHGMKPKTNQYLETSIKGIYVAGDGAGMSRGIVGAAASGLLAAEGILKEIE